MASHAAVTPSDKLPLPLPGRYFWVGTAGDIRLRGIRPDDLPVTLKNVPSGLCNFPWPVAQVYATGTTATGIVQHAEGNPTRSLVIT